MKKRKLVLPALALGVVATSATVYQVTKDFTKKYLYRNVIRRPDISQTDVEKITIKNKSGLMLYGYFIEQSEAKKTFVMLHELNGDSDSLREAMAHFEGMLPHTNILLLDAAAHGMSDGYLKGLGYFDMEDLVLWNSYLINRLGEDHSFIFYGVGMGANTILNAAGAYLLRNTQAIISEGAYSDVLSYLTYHCFKERFLPPVCTSFFIKRIVKKELGVDVEEMNTVEYVKHNTIPTLYIHSKNNQDVPFKDVLSLYNNNLGKAELFPIKEDHFYEMNQDDEYSQTIVHFINEYCR